MHRRIDMYIGIDPGAHGAIAFYTPMVFKPDKDKLDVYDYTNFGDMDKQIKRHLEETPYIIAVIELVHAFPGQGVTGMFNFGVNFGGWQGLLIGNEIPCYVVSPQRWQKEMLKKADGKNTKDRSRVMAARKFPGQKDLFKRKKDADRADAALIAFYASRVYF